MKQRTRILFVDDDKRILNGLRRQLHGKRDVWDVSFAESGPAALAVLETDGLDVIVTDMRMPGMDGAELLTQVVERWPRLARMVLSGHADPDRLLLARSCAHRYLDKPCPASVLEVEVARAMSVRHTLDRLHCEALDDVWSRPPGVTDLCEDMIEAVGSDATSFDAARMFGSDMDLWRRVRGLLLVAFPDRASASVEAGELSRAVGARHLFSVTMAVRFLDAFVGQETEVWNRAQRMSVHAAAVATGEGLGDDDVVHALISGALDVMELPERDAGDLQTADWEVMVLFLLQSWGLPEPVVHALAWRDRPSQVESPRPGPLAALLAAELLVAPLESAAGLSAARREDLCAYIRAVGWEPRELVPQLPAPVSDTGSGGFRQCRPGERRDR